VANLIHGDRVRVVDIIHSNISYIHTPYLSDVLVLIQTLGTAGVIDINTLNEVFLIMAIIQFLRSICSVSTILPPLKDYHDKYRMGGLNGSGTEYIFSGHASYSALATIYLYTRKIVPVLPLVLYNIISQFLIIATHNHYTVDIILAWIIVPLVYGNIQFCKSDEYCSSMLKQLL